MPPILGLLLVLIVVGVIVAIVPMDGQIRQTVVYIAIGVAAIVLVVWLFRFLPGI